MQLIDCSLQTLSKDWNEAPRQLDSPQSVAFVFGPSHLSDNDDFFRKLRREAPQAHLIGCSTAGEIHHDIVRDNSLAMAVMRLEHSEVRSASLPISGEEGSRKAGATLAAMLDAENLRALFVLSDGLHVNGTELIRGINGSLKRSVVITGGLAGDGTRFGRTWVLSPEGMHSNKIAAVGLYGAAIQVGHGSMGGWDKFGVVRTVTRSRGNTLYELDGKPALDLYKEYLGERSAELPSSALLFPLTLVPHNPDDGSVVRTVLAIDEGDRSMTFAGDIPQGGQVQLMRANFNRLIHSAANAASLVRHNAPRGADVLSIAISCVGRRLVLGERTEEEIEATLEQLPPGTRQIGFYSYGEISPVASGRCELHNQTMTLTTFAERSRAASNAG